MDRDIPRTLKKRFDIISEWKAMGVDFLKNCVFVDEAGFHSQMMRGRGWATVGKPASVKVPMQKGINISIVGCISPFGTISFSKVEPLKQSDAEKIQQEFPQPSSQKRKAKTPEDEKKSFQTVPLRITLSNSRIKLWMFWTDTTKRGFILSWIMQGFTTQIS